MSELRVNATATAGGTDAYRYVDTVYFTSSGTFTKADYPWLRAIRVKCQGAGGGGGAGTIDYRCGSGGGGGAYAEDFITDIVSLSASETVTVGAKGLGGVAASGSSGGASSFGSVVVCGGGAFGVVPTNAGGAGGTVSTSNELIINGSNGGWGGQYTDGGNGLGGHSFLGFGAPNSIAGGGGLPGLPYGGGGSGGYRFTSTTRQGGDGADGIVIVELYA